MERCLREILWSGSKGAMAKVLRTRERFQEGSKDLTGGFLRKKDFKSLVRYGELGEGRRVVPRQRCIRARITVRGRGVWIAACRSAQSTSALGQTLHTEAQNDAREA